MPLLSTETIKAETPAGRVTEKIKINVNTDGDFYCDIPDVLKDFFGPVSESYPKTRSEHAHTRRGRAGKEQLFAKTKADLVDALQNALIATTQPEVTREPVIRYNIQSMIAFAEDAEGNVFPNAGYPGAQWPTHNNRYGDIRATSKARNGYSLTIGAVAAMKVTKRLGNHESVSYEPYYRGGSHHGRDNPAEKLNSWGSFSLPEQCQEIPYTDESALFFHNLMHGMAALSKMIQEHTFDQDRLLQMIESGTPLNLLKPPVPSNPE